MSLITLSSLKYQNRGHFKGAFEPFILDSIEHRGKYDRCWNPINGTFMYTDTPLPKQDRYYPFDA